MEAINLKKMTDIPIAINYKTCSDILYQDIAKQENAVTIQSDSGIILGNDYYQIGYPGTKKSIFCRESVYRRLKKITTLLAPNYGLYIFDAFRSLATQKYLFDLIYNEIQQKKPHLTTEDLNIETQKYVYLPNQFKDTNAPPHNTGGAIDLCIVNLKTSEPLEFGCPIDFTEAISSTDYFEQAYQPNTGFTEQQWMTVRSNRRILFHLMTQQGFTNFSHEWWHYDIGNASWAKLQNVKPIYHSMEDAVKNSAI